MYCTGVPIKLSSTLLLLWLMITWLLPGVTSSTEWHTRVRGVVSAVADWVVNRNFMDTIV